MAFSFGELPPPTCWWRRSGRTGGSSRWCESIDRISRITYVGTKIEYELEQAGVALLAADEGVDRAAMASLAEGVRPVKGATSTLTRRVKQAVAEWYVINMLELS